MRPGRFRWRRSRRGRRRPRRHRRRRAPVRDRPSRRANGRRVVADPAPGAATPRRSVRRQSTAAERRPADGRRDQAPRRAIVGLRGSRPSTLDARPRRHQEARQRPPRRVAPSASSRALNGAASVGGRPRRLAAAGRTASRMPRVTVVDQISKLWSDFLAFLSQARDPRLAGPDRAAAPSSFVIGLVGPLVTLGILALARLRRHRSRAPSSRTTKGARPAPLDHTGRPIIPAGEPYCPRDGLIYPFGPQRCEADRSRLLLRCPKCEVVARRRRADLRQLRTGLKVEPRAMSCVRPTGRRPAARPSPDPGGLAATQRTRASRHGRAVDMSAWT